MRSFSPVVYCALHDPSDVDCQRHQLTWTIRVARARQSNGQGVMDDRETGRRGFEPASYRLIHAYAGRKIVVFSAQEALSVLRMLSQSGLNVPPSALERLHQEAMACQEPPVKTAANA